MHHKQQDQQEDQLEGMTLYMPFVSQGLEYLRGRKEKKREQQKRQKERQKEKQKEKQAQREKQVEGKRTKFENSLLRLQSMNENPLIIYALMVVQLMLLSYFLLQDCATQDICYDDNYKKMAVLLLMISALHIFISITISPELRNYQLFSLCILCVVLISASLLSENSFFKMLYIFSLELYLFSIITNIFLYIVTRYRLNFINGINFSEVPPYVYIPFILIFTTTLTFMIYGLIKQIKLSSILVSSIFMLILFSIISLIITVILSIYVKDKAISISRNLTQKAKNINLRRMLF